MLTINEIFYSIQGESSFSGRPCVFVRLTACDLRCRWCDTPYAFNEDEAVTMTEAGADIVVAHMGCTSGGTIGAKSTKTLDTCVARIQAIVDACKQVRRDVICLCHGGPIAMPADAQYVIDRVLGIDGFYGASSTERFPTEVAIKAQIERFKALRLPR